MTELKDIKIEDLNVTKATFIKLIGLLNLDLELPNDERIIFDEEVEKFESGQVIAFYHLLVYGDNLYNFCLSFFLSSLTSNSFYLSGYSVDICNFSNQYLLDCLYESGILTPVEEEDNPEQTSAEDAEEQDNPELTPAEENKEGVELTPLERTVFELLEESVNLEDVYIFDSLKSNGEHEQKLLELASVEASKQYVFEYLISKAGLELKYQAWLQERKEQKAVTVI